MPTDPAFERAVNLMRNGDYHELRVLLIQYPNLVFQRDSSDATLMHKLFEMNENSPNVANSIRTLLLAGTEVNDRQNPEAPVPILCALRSRQLDAARTLLEFGANFHANAQPLRGTVLDYAIELCKEQSEDKDFKEELSGLIYAYTGGQLK